MSTPTGSNNNGHDKPENGSQAAVPTHPLLISNKPYLTSKSFPVHSPKTNTLIHNFSSASIPDVDAAISSAHQAYPRWKRLPPAQKRTIFLKAADLMDARQALLTKYAVEATGATESWIGANLALAAEITRDVAGRISGIVGSIPTAAEEGTSALIYQEPYGTVLAIAPWNAPYVLGVRAVVYPLAAGNTVILKAPELSPMCSLGIVQIFHEAGLPEGVLNLIAHAPEDAASVTRHLIESPYIKKINFTGSTAVGRIIAEMAGRNLTPVLLELGGKSPAIVCEDADLELAARECAMGAFWHGGQICMSTERVIVFEEVAEEFEMEFKKAVKAFSGGPFGGSGETPVLVNAAAVAKNKRLLKDAVSKGAEVVVGKGEGGEGARMGNTVVKGVKKGMDLFYTESFGPTVSLCVVKGEEEAVELANDVEHGLSAAIFTKDLRRAGRMAREIESGAVHINGMTIHDEAQLPHGGKCFFLLQFCDCWSYSCCRTNPSMTLDVKRY